MNAATRDPADTEELLLTPTGSRRLRVAAAAPDLRTHLARSGRCPGPAAPIVGLLEACGLTGRGGAGFPSARKLAAVASGKRAVVVANGAEGEPLSSKDRCVADPRAAPGPRRAAAGGRGDGAAEAYVYVPEDLCAPITSSTHRTPRIGPDRRHASRRAPDTLHLRRGIRRRLKAFRWPGRCRETRHGWS